MLPKLRKTALAGVVAAMLVAAPMAVFAADAGEYVAEAKEALAKGEVKTAVIQLKNALQTDPAHVEARLLLGSLHLRNGDGAAAAKEFGRARDLDAQADSWVPGYARALTLQGEFRKLLDEVPVQADLAATHRADLHALRGNAHLALREVEAAVTEYDAALALQSGNATARLGKARLLLAENRQQEALEQLNQVLLEEPGHVESRLVRGDLLRRLQRLDDAEIDYARAAKEAPNNPRAHIGLALVHIAQRNIPAAKADLEVLNGMTRDLPAVNYLQALVSFQERDYDRASDELQTLLRVAPSNLQAQLLYGIVSYARNSFTLADDYLTRVLASAPGNPQVLKLVGAARLKLKQPERAVAVLEPAISGDTNDAQLLALLGTAYIQLGDNQRGAQMIERAVELDPEQALLRTQLAVGKIAAGDTSEAISQLESAVALGQDVIQADVLLVLSYLNKQDYDKAIAASRALETRMADSPIPFNLTGLAFLAQRNFDAAREGFNTALEKDPNFLVARMNLARLALIEKEPQAADAAYDQVLASDPGHLGALMGKAQLAKDLGDPEKAEEWLLKANQANPQEIRPILILAEDYLRRNEGLKAVNMLSGLPPDKARIPAVLRLKGMAHLQTGDFPSATHTLKQLTESMPNSVEGWFQLARAYAASGNIDGSRQAFKQAIAFDTERKTPIVLVGLAELEMREQRYDAALAIGEQLRRDYPQHVFGFDVLASAYRGKGDTERAIASAREALRIERNGKRINSLARSLASSDKAAESIQLLKDWLAGQPEDGPLWATLGMVSQQVGQEEQALQAYEKAIQLTGPDAVLANNMAWLYLDRDRKRAVELATKAYELAPSRAEIVDTYGWVLFKAGRKADGLAALQQAMIIAPRNPEIALHVGEALLSMQRDAEARPVLERIAREHPNSKFAESARALMAQLRG
ncbi:MAG: PEP-CTERM system TPR-repeat protein PrsT [Gammaproteobacteria bacterium]|nr:PEP-CTERM system TPR-repeat protein PrsT [Gammaproteobacteria bacterium]